MSEPQVPLTAQPTDTEVQKSETAHPVVGLPCEDLQTELPEKILALAAAFTEANDRGDALSDEYDEGRPAPPWASEQADEDYNRTKAQLFSAVRKWRGIERTTKVRGWEAEQPDADFTARIKALLFELHDTDILSEQQCAKYWGTDLLTWRFLRAQPTPHPWISHPASWDEKALTTAQEISLMWGHDRSNFVSKIQVAVRDAIRWAAREARVEPVEGSRLTARSDEKAPAVGVGSPVSAGSTAMEVLRDMRELASSMRHSAGTWMVPGWDGHKVADLLDCACTLVAQTAADV